LYAQGTTNAHAQIVDARHGKYHIWLDGKRCKVGNQTMLYLALDYFVATYDIAYKLGGCEGSR